MAREQEHLTQDELAAKSGLSSSQIYRIESGHSKPSADALDAIAGALDRSADWLLGRTDIPQIFLESNLTDDQRRWLTALETGDLSGVMDLLGRMMTALDKDLKKRDRVRSGKSSTH